MKDAEARKRKLNAELANGRLAMMAIIGMFYQDGLTGSAWGDWALYTDSPLRAFESELGVQAPFGFWDPIGFTKDGNVTDFTRRRAIEVKHGRVSMLATMGYITPELTGKFPGYLSPSLDLKFQDIPNGLAAVSKVPALGWVQIVVYGFYCERTSSWGSSPDCGWKPPLLATEDPELKSKRLNAEIANGRLAMMAIIGMFFQDGLTGSAWGDWALYTDSPLRAFDPTQELGVQAPVQFWDPLGFCNDGDEAAFKRRRAVEIKHGRISMLACIGYIIPEYFRFPGYLSPSLDLKFSDVPNGFGAISKVPALGWAQIVVFAGMMEARFSQNETSPGDFGFGFLGACGLLGKVQDPEVRKQKLNAEIANGRLAMFAIIALFFQNGVTGSTGSELYGFGDNSAVVWGKILLPSLAAFAFAGESFRNGPDEKFLKYFPRDDYFGKDKRI